MRKISPVMLAAAPLLPLVLVSVAQAQASADDTARSRTVRQTGAPFVAANDSVFRRAEQLVREGRGDAGRALVDTVLAATRPGSMQHGQALYWRASLAADAAEAERGYRRVILEYPATGWSGDALLNLAQLEMARGDQEQALLHLHRFEREYASHESRARAAFWLARLYFDRKNDRRGCAALATARVAASPEDVELRNQIDYYDQRCIGVDTAVATPARPMAGATTEVKASATASVSVPPVNTPPAVPAGAAAAAPSTGQTAPDAKRDSQPVTPATPTPATPSTSRVSVGVGGYTVQVAAYDSRPAAEALIAKLKTRGYTARLASSTRPFRVRIGRYDTRAEAAAAQQRLKAKGIVGFVTEMEQP
jgi:cell division septation protein DedD